MAASRNSRSPDPSGSLRQAAREGLARAAALGRPGGRFGTVGLRVVAALSGGRDSVVLLHILAGLRDDTGIVLSALHVHHGLSPHADAWAAFCEEVCSLCNVPLAIEHVAVPRDSGQGIEGAARARRHAVFERVAADVVVLAHHAGDQAETLLFNLSRGSGVNGLSAMAQLCTSPRGPLLLRPWLSHHPEAIEACRMHHGLRHIDDESNRDTRFSRNFLRHAVLGPVESRFPGAIGRIAGAARRLGEARGLLAELADADLSTIRGDASIELAGLLALPPARRRNALHRWLETLGSALTESGLDELLRQVESASRDARIERRCGGFDLLSWRGRLYAVRQHRPRGGAAPRAWQGEPGIGWGDGVLHFEAAAGEGVSQRRAQGLELRSRTGGERIRLRPGGPSRALRLLFQESAIPPWEREALPLVFRGDTLVAVPGIGVATEFACAPGEPGWRLRWQK